MFIVDLYVRLLHFSRNGNRVRRRSAERNLKILAALS